MKLKSSLAICAPRHLFGVLLCGLLLSACGPTGPSTSEKLAPQDTSSNNAALYADTLYVNGDILTMDGDKPTYVEAVSVSNGKIQQIGLRSELEKLMGTETKIIDLNGKTMLPGFIDPHGHFMFALNMVNQVNVASPPVGTVTDITSLLDNLDAFQKSHKISEGDWLVGWGYDQTELAEKRHITKLDLDARFPHNKVMLIHVSGHGAVLNSKALEWAKIDASTATPEGGIIARMPGSNEPAGLLMETAYLPVFANLPKPTEEAQLALVDPAQQMYASEGYTHAQEGFSHASDADFLIKAAAQGRIYLDLVSLLGFTDMNKWLNNPAYPIGTYKSGLKFQGIKITQDGSPQGKTAYMRDSFLTGGPNGEKDWHGESTLSYESFAKVVKTAVDNKLQIFIHANGDATIDEAIKAIDAAGVTAKDDARTVIIHSQFQRPEHLDSYARLGISPSYFTNHTFFWGDVHIENVGLEKASFISPIMSAKAKGLVTSNHTDFNVTPLDPMFVIWTAMARETRNGVILGEHERADAYTALQALTTGPAYQIFEEERKGKIKAGLLADFVILDKNPMKVPVKDIRGIEVLETIKEGKTIYPKI
ncbi:amidohydrolase [Shewanella baltica]|uniref:Amidohydrolase 3 n=1 Tax=Shewanella baltica (strain OS155 / ATCC BAA-1091) TaxID=325240 RepID=A3D0M3_SHEB5|nr:amidohydrolase [Shewanella baltica]ABN60286.1 Amidohydrolase 3 [Shewanella baltica OS155]AEH12677.1 Amidohydrolase 3 [Shewanella baltica OS117]